jgi:hypothetical protein
VHESVQTSSRPDHAKRLKDVMMKHHDVQPLSESTIQSTSAVQLISPASLCCCDSSSQPVQIDLARPEDHLHSTASEWLVHLCPAAEDSQPAGTAAVVDMQLGHSNGAVQDLALRCGQLLLDHLM